MRIHIVSEFYGATALKLMALSNIVTGNRKSNVNKGLLMTSSSFFDKVIRLIYYPFFNDFRILL